MSKIYETKKAADGYDSSREIPAETLVLWMDVIKELVPVHTVRSVLDLGGGTGRFSFMLNQIYGCPIITSDPSFEMLKQGVKNNIPNVTWITSKAEYIPLVSDSFDLVFMSQVYHHIEDMEHAFNEIFRVLRSDGSLLIRNGTYESDNMLDWHDFFAGVREFDTGRIPYRSDVEKAASKYGFKMNSMQMVNQIFASSYDEYYEKISKRGLSALIAIKDEDFEAGLIKLREWADSKPKNTPVPDPVDIFHFKKS